MRQAASRAVQIIGLVGSVLTIVMGYIYWYPTASKDARPAIAILSFCVMGLLAVLIWRELVYSRKARYSEILSLLNEIHATLQGLALERDATPSQIKMVCTRVSNFLAEAFSVVTSTKCSVCIKVIEVDPLAQNNHLVRPKVQTLCRDDRAERKRQLADKSEIAHWIDRNTDFYDLHEKAGTPLEDCFFSNHLPSHRGYVNTSFDVYGRADETFFLSRWFQWSLPYKSTVVVPIGSQVTGSQPGRRLAGYLCVDSRSRGVFSRRYDPELLGGVADCLYPIVKRYCDVLATAQEEELR